MVKEVTLASDTVSEAVLNLFRSELVSFSIASPKQADTKPKRAYASISVPLVQGKSIIIQGVGASVGEQYQWLMDSIYPKSMESKTKDSQYQVSPLLKSILG
jgi:hypothetical protein